MQNIITAKSVADHVGVGVEAVRVAHRKGELPAATMIGGTMCWPAAALPDLEERMLRRAARGPNRKSAMARLPARTMIGLSTYIDPVTA